MITQEFIEFGGNDIYLVHYLDSFCCDTCILIVPALSWIHIGPNRLYTLIGNRGIDHGISTITFDYFGHGESSGDSDEITLELLIQSFIKVYRYTKNMYKNVVVLADGIGTLIVAECKDVIDEKEIMYIFPEFRLSELAGNFINESKIEERSSLDYQCISRSIRRKNYSLFRGLFGSIHDSKYIPVPVALLKDISRRTHNNYVYQKYNYTIFGSVKEVEHSKSNIKIIDKPLFTNNRFPEDWYEQINLWPKELEKLSNEIVTEVYNKIEKQHVIKKKLIPRFKSNIIKRKSLIYLDNNEGKGQLHGIIQNPTNKIDFTDAVIFIPGVGGDKVDNHRTWPRFAEILSQKGIQSLRYENSFSGISYGRLDDYTIGDVVEETHRFLELLKTLNNRIDINYHFVSWSAGIKIVLRLFETYPESISSVCAWNPILEDNPQKRGDSKAIPKYEKNTDGNLVTQVGGEFIGLNYVKEDRLTNYSNLCDKYMEQLSSVWSSELINNKIYKKLYRDNKISVIESNDHLFSYSLMEKVFIDTLSQLFNYEEKL